MDAAWTSPWTSIGRPYVDVRETLRPDTTAALVASCDSFTIERFGVATGGAAAGGLRPVEKTITGPLAWSEGAPLGLGVSDCTEDGGGRFLSLMSGDSRAVAARRAEADYFLVERCFARLAREGVSPDSSAGNALR
jgi:hypothetical protein